MLIANSGGDVCVCVCVCVLCVWSQTDSWGAAKAEPSAQDLMAAMKQEGW